MVFTLHRYIFKDLFKAFTLTTIILSFVMGLGVMLKPLRDFSIDPTHVPEMIFYTLPITMTMVIPIAALMATTLVYGRLAFENEITACRSSGIGLPTLIYPALILALMVGVITLLLNFQVNPDFISKFEGIFTKDAESIIYRNIEKKGNLGHMFPNTLIHADKVDAENHRLIGAVVIIKNKTKVKQIFSADTITIKMPQEGDQGNQIFLRLTNSCSIGDEIDVEQGGMCTFSTSLPSFFADDIKFKKLDELKRIRSDMSRFSEIRDHFDIIRKQLTAELFFEWCDQQLRSKVSLTLTASNQYRYILYANQCTKRLYKKIKLSEMANEDVSAIISPAPERSLYVNEYRPGENTPSNQYLAIPNPKKKHPVTAKLEFNANTTTPTATLKLENVERHSFTDSRRPRLGIHPIPNIVIPQNIIDKVNLIPFNNFINKKAGPLLEHDKPSQYLTVLSERLKKECLLLHSEITAELHSRLAFGICCVILTLMGAGLGIVFRSGHLLTAFGISIGPAAFCLITIFTGQHIAEVNTSNFNTGLIFLWSGIATVAIGNFVMYRKLTKL